ncbi:protein SCO1/2 [Faunimonas pinastri]|uniref:Protein SCO1/2 n=1 Tax=Faunimonas pinastri TaxID=1855383 RepID=A0A1H8ZWV7_9HYPH|nr:SCO family protein [Faunimonas pinastri]SEP68919.1 protein SCO1/2 [Faunimonas pinastri]
MNSYRAVRVGLWVLIVLTVIASAGMFIGGYMGMTRQGPPQNDQDAQATKIQPFSKPFQLVDQDGKPVDQSILQGKPTALFFGYTHCPDVCPATLSEMTIWADKLGTDADKLQFVFVTVDPERDTPAVLKEYLTAFGGKVTALSGEPDKVRAMLDQSRVYYKKVPDQSGGYSMDHTASVFLLDAEGSLVGTIVHDEKDDTAVAKLKRLVA